jgi:hypothetical protein
MTGQGEAGNTAEGKGERKGEGSRSQEPSLVCGVILLFRLCLLLISFLLISPVCRLVGCMDRYFVGSLVVNQPVLIHPLFNPPLLATGQNKKLTKALWLRLDRWK